MQIEQTFKQVSDVLKRGIYGPHMLAFLPAICLSAYWGGGEVLLVLCALVTPLLYALTGGFGRLAPVGYMAADPPPGPDVVAQQFLEIAQHNGQTTACFQLSLSGLSEIDRAFGDHAAQEARQVVKARLRSALRQGDQVFQTGDTRFTVLIAPGFRLKLDSLLDLGKRLRAAAEAPLSVAGTRQYLSVAMGVASSLTFGRNVTAQIWLASAVEALEDAALTDPSGTRVWSDKLSRKVKSRHSLRDDLRTAFDAGQIQAFFQPQVNLLSGEVVGVEALARWDHPARGTLLPSEFLPLVAASGTLPRLGQIILSDALAALRVWDSEGLHVPSVSVNVSGCELQMPSFSDDVLALLDRHEVPAHRLGIEVLEDVIAADADDVTCHNLRSLAEAGCRIELDDFGTSSASIQMLRRFPVTRVKIDRSFIREADRHEDKREMLSALVSMTDRLGLEVLAEGIETVGEHGALKHAGFALGQGFLFAHPAPATEMSAWLSERQNTNAPEAHPKLRRVK